MKKRISYLLFLFVAISCHMEIPLSPVAGFTFTPSTGCQAPCSITFKNTSVNGNAVEWNFDDGSPKQTGEEVTHQFTGGKKFYVKLVSRSESGGSSGITNIVEITAAATAKPTSAFTVSMDNNGLAPSKVTFNNQSYNGTKYEWDFGDSQQATTANPNTSTLKSPSHNYIKEGTYTVTLKTSNNAGESATSTEKVTIVVKETIFDAISIKGDFNYASGIASDADGNVYVCGNAKGSVDFGNNIIKTSYSNSNDFFVAKYNNKGKCVWAVLEGSTAFDQAYGIVLDNNNNVYIAGSLGGMPRTTALTQYGSSDGFVSKINGITGNTEWFKNLGGPGNDIATALGFYQTSAGPRIYLTGFVTGDGSSNINFGTSKWSADGEDVFFVFVDASTGEIKQPSIRGGSGSQRASAMVLDNEGNAYLTGTFEQTMSFGSPAQVLKSAGNEDVFVARWVLSPGQFQWAEKSGSGSSDTSTDIIVDKDKNVYVTGKYTGYFSELGVSSAGDDNVYVGKWPSAGGKSMWGRSGFNDGKQDYPGGLAVAQNGNILVLGSYLENGKFPFSNTANYSSSGSTDIIISEILPGDGNTSGKLQKGNGGTGDDRAAKVCVASDGQIYATGYFTGEAVFNGVRLYGASNMPNTFITKFRY